MPYRTLRHVAEEAPTTPPARDLSTLIGPDKMRATALMSHTNPWLDIHPPGAPYQRHHHTTNPPRGVVGLAMRHMPPWFLQDILLADVTGALQRIHASRCTSQSHPTLHNLDPGYT